jgi:hypothetical protein
MTATHPIMTKRQPNDTNFTAKAKPTIVQELGPLVCTNDD